ncbi:MAG: lysozyme inhibitor LprI family protein [Bacillota bacterium]
MRPSFILLILFLTCGSAAAADSAPTADDKLYADLGCGRPGLDEQTQVRCAQLDLVMAKKEMAQVYQQVLQRYAADTQFITKLKASQAAWSAYFDAEMAALYPDPRGVAAYGSGFPTCNAGAAAYLIERRSQELRRWLEGAAVGDVCAGSIHAQDEGSAD